MSLLSWTLAMFRLPPRAGADQIKCGVDVVKPLVAVRNQSSCGGRWRRSLSAAPNAHRTNVNASEFNPKNRPAQPTAPVRLPMESSELRKTPPDLRASHLTFSAMLVKYVNERFGGKASIVYRRAGIDRRHYAKIVSDNEYAVSRETALQLAIGLQLERAELDEFLHSAGFVLTPTLALDRAFIYCLENGIRNILDVNRIIVEAGLQSLRIRF